MEKKINNPPCLIQETETPISIPMESGPFKAQRISIENKESFHGWFGHPKEEKLFLCLSGSMRILMVKPDNWEDPSLELKVLEQVLIANKSQMLYVPVGYVTAVQKISNDGQVLEFSTISKEEFDSNGKTFPKEWWYVETFM